MSSHLSYLTLLRFVKEKIGFEVLMKIFREIKFQKYELYVIKPTKQRIKQSIIICIYRDLTNIGQNKLLKQICKWYHMSLRSFQHNLNKSRNKLKNWGQTLLLKPPSMNQLKKSAKNNLYAP